MARSKRPTTYKKRRRKAKRSEAEYVTAAKNLSVLVPSLRPLAKRKKLNQYEKSRITRKERILKGVPNIFPVSRQQAKKLGNQVFATGVQGIQLRGVSPNARIQFNGRDIRVTDNGRTWLYWHLSRSTVRSRPGMRGAAKRAFEQQFPIELVSDLTEKAFATKAVVQVNLWAHAGIVGDPHHTLSEFVQWVNQKWSAGRYVRTSEHGGNSDPGKWVNGIAILLEDENYAARRKELIEQNKHVLRDMEEAGRKERIKREKRLASKGLAPDLTPITPAAKRRVTMRMRPRKKKKKAAAKPVKRKTKKRNK